MGCIITSVPLIERPTPNGISARGAAGDVRENIPGFETTQGLMAGIAPPPTALWAGLAVDRRWRVLAGVIDPVLGIELHIAIAAVVDA